MNSKNACIVKIKNYIQNIENEYMNFAGIKYFPEIHVRKMAVPENNVYAVASYNYSSKTHYLTITPQIIENNADYLLYHEFTHIIDHQNFGNIIQNDIYINFGYSGFSAAFMEMMKLAGAKNIDGQFSFNLSDSAYIIDCVGDQISLSGVLWQAYQDAIGAFSKFKFDKLNDYTQTIELLFNFFGKKYVCQRYATEQDDTMNMMNFSSIEAFLYWDGNNPIQEWNKLLTYPLVDEGKLKLADDLCNRTICYFRDKDGLQEININSELEELFVLPAINNNSEVEDKL